MGTPLIIWGSFGEYVKRLFVCGNYSVGENSGFKLDNGGGIDILIAVQQPDGVPEENWLPINRGDYGIGIIMRLYAPDLKRYKTWTPPKAERVK